MRRLAPLLLLLATGVALANDSTREWRTVESEHFIVNYYEPNGEVAHRVAVVAERAHRVLTPILKHVPEEKTQIVITDDVDGANGFAGVIPRNQINLFASAPESLSELNDHDDWLYGLVAHEYTHIIHLDTIEGIPYAYNKILGKYWSPNNVQPRWFIEGLAVYEESKRSASGRTRNAIFDMYLRAAVLAGKQLDLDAVSSGPYFWPHGSAAYLYGSFFLKYIADRFGDDVMARISHEYGVQPVPFGINRAVARVTGEDYLQLYAEWSEHLRRRFALQKQEVLRRGLIEGRKLTNTGEYNSPVKFSADGSEIWWQQADGHSDARYRRMPADGDYTKARDLALFIGGGPFNPLPDGNGIIVERDITYRTFYSFTDLYRVDLQPGGGYKETRLTRGKRTRGPVMSPDGKRIACAINGNSRRKLAIFPAGGDEEGPPEIIWEGGRWDQAYDPAWSRDGKTIAFSTWTSGGYADIYLYDVDSKQITPITHDRAIDAWPRFSGDGRLVYFTSERTGIYNIFAYDRATGDLWQVTNVLTGTFSFDVSPDGKKLVYSAFDDDGFELYLLDLDPSKFLPAEPYVDERPAATAIPDDEAPVSPPRDYRAAESIQPLQWMASFTKDSFGDAVTVSTNGGDVAGLYAWSISGTYGFTRGDTSFAASFFTNKYWPGLGLTLSHGTGRAGGLYLDGRNTLWSNEAWGFSSSISLPVLRDPELFSQLTFGYGLYWLRNTGDPPRQDPNAMVPVLPNTGRFGGATISWFLSNIRGFVYTLGPILGNGFSLTAHAEHPSLGATTHQMSVTYRWDHYQGLPWLGHVLALRLQGGIQQSEDPGGGLFYLGGVYKQDLVDAVIHSTRFGSSWLRGYPLASIGGHQYHLLNLEYRMPVGILEKGLGTLPFYLRRVHLAALLDVGNAYDGTFAPEDLRVSIGASLRVDAVFGWYMGGALDLGVSRGLSRGGITEWWLLLTNTI